jgi:uncharacterized protein
MPRKLFVLTLPFEGFEWDEWNRQKNWVKHKVSIEEAEEAFFDSHCALFLDTAHAKTESRHILLGKTKLRRLLYIAFTIRKNRIRVISARDVTKLKEVKLYEEAA